jgi:hypothetical protein
VTTRLAAAALAAVVLGTVVTYGWGSSSASAWTTGLLIMVAGTATLAGILLRTMLGLRHTTRARRPETTSSPAGRQVPRPTLGEMSAATALRNGAAGRRFADSAETASPPTS